MAWLGVWEEGFSDHAVLACIRGLLDKYCDGLASVARHRKMFLPEVLWFGDDDTETVSKSRSIPELLGHSIYI
eukprot:6117417-Amphidinium_carterae.2